MVFPEWGNTKSGSSVGRIIVSINLVFCTSRWLEVFVAAERKMYRTGEELQPTPVPEWRLHQRESIVAILTSDWKHSAGERQMRTAWKGVDPAAQNTTRYTHSICNNFRVHQLKVCQPHLKLVRLQTVINVWLAGPWYKLLLSFTQDIQGAVGQWLGEHLPWLPLTLYNIAIFVHVFSGQLLFSKPVKWLSLSYSKLETFREASELTVHNVSIFCLTKHRCW